jgi:predicted nucleic acid-binding protein
MTPILLDTSSWVEYLRDTGSAICERVDELIQSDSVLATTDIVIMELFSGARAQDDRKKIWALMNRCVMLPVRPLLEYERAAELYLRCRANGFTPVNSNELLVASVAI